MCDLEIKLHCNHEASKLTFSKMFQNDNGWFGGEVVTILLDCECGDTIFIYSYRGNVSEQYIKPNAVLCNNKDKCNHDLKLQDVW